MISFKEFLMESEVRKSRLTDLDFDRAVELVKANCQSFLRLETPLYRGNNSISDYTFGESDAPGITPRKSTVLKDNFYTVWMDNNPAWDGFPKRSKSFICSNSKKAADEYGTVYNVYPYDEALVGMAAADDIWYSFVDTGIDDMAHFQNCIGMIIRYMNDTLDTAMTYEEMCDTFKRVTLHDVEIIRDSVDYLYIIGDTVARTMETLNCDNLYEVFSKVVVPEFFEYAHMNEADFIDIPETREFYIQGKVVFIKASVNDEFLEAVNGN